MNNKDEKLTIKNLLNILEEDVDSITMQQIFEYKRFIDNIILQEGK